jgi:hypothetical protein
LSVAATGPSERHAQVLSDLYELIAALDRRVPQLNRLGERQIAAEAADLRERAVQLIRHIEGDARKQ